MGYMTALFLGSSELQERVLRAKAARLQRSHVPAPRLGQTPRDVSHG